MAIGGGIFLIVIGGILGFAVRDNWDAIDLTMVGYICIGAGILAILLSLVVNAQNSKSTRHEVVEHHTDGPAGGPVQ